MKATKTPADSEPPEGATLFQEPSGLWRAMVNLGGELVPLGYFGSREDAEDIIAAYDRPQRPRTPPLSAPGVE